MALLNRPLTNDEVRRMWAGWKTYEAGSFTRELLEAMSEPTPHTVHYYAGGDIRFYTPPECFHWAKRSQHGSPSDCVWIVPGTHMRDEKGFW